MYEYINESLKDITAYVHDVVGGNEFAAGAILAWLLAVAGFLFRSWPTRVWKFLMKHAGTTLTIHSSHDVFYVVGAYLEYSGFVNNSRVIKLSNREVPYSLARDDDEEDKRIKEVGYGTQVFWHSWYRPLVISVTKEESASSAVKEIIHITKLGRSHKFFDRLVSEAYEMDKQNISEMIRCYMQEAHTMTMVAQQPRLSLDSVVISPDNRRKLLSTLDDFHSSEDWYVKHNVPYQLGILLYGPPGTGKTSLIKAIAGLLHRDVVYVRSATHLVRALTSANNNRIIVLEEVDTFELGSRDDDLTKEENNQPGVYKESKVGLGEVLNAMDGVVTHHGRVVIMTSNKPDKLDSALLRPGRIDLKLQLDNLDSYMFNGMLLKFFPEHDSRELNVVPNVSHADLQNDIINGMQPDALIEKYTT